MGTIKNILFFLALAIPGVPFVNSLNLIWKNQKVFPDDIQQVFPDDIQWLEQLKNMKRNEVSSNEVDSEKYEICQTEECKKVADEFLSSMNKTIDPCEDFYEFACGGWKINNPIPPSMPSWSRFMIFQTAVQYRIKNALEEEPKSSDILPVRQAKKWYRSCMNEETLDRRGIKPIESILMQAGGWPITMDEEEWNGEEYTWQKVEHIYSTLTGSYVFYDVKGAPTQKATKYGEIRLLPSTLPLGSQSAFISRNYTGEELKIYKNFLEKIVHLFVKHNHADVSKEKIRKEIEEMIDFERELYELRDRKWRNNNMVYGEFIEWYNDNVTETEARIHWEIVIQKLFDMVDIEIHQFSSILIPDPSYVTGIGELLGKTKSRTIVNYIHWKFVADMLQFTTDDMRNEIFTVMANEYGIEERPPRWKECVNEMKMTHAAGYTFVKQFFTKSTETPARVMIKNIQNELENLIDESYWLDETSRKASKEKIKNMHIFIGFPNWYNNRTALINLYKGLTIGADYFDNTLSYIRYENKNELKKYAEKVESADNSKEIWYVDPITVNALYFSENNMINVPAVDFQSPLFTKGLPDNVNYAIAGLIVGHEMGHGFDDSGILSGDNGKRTKLSKTALDAYYQRAECFLDQFAEYYGETPAPETDGTTKKSLYGRYQDDNKASITRGENIADTTGMQAVFQAYKKLKKPNGHARLPGLEEFTDDQLFFFSFAAMWCEIGTPKYEEKKSKEMDCHSPPKFRVIGALSNTKDFAKAFNCPQGSSMNPEDKCTIWEKSGADSNPPKKSNNYRWGGQWRF